MNRLRAVWFCSFLTEPFASGLNCFPLSHIRNGTVTTFRSSAAQHPHAAFARAPFLLRNGSYYRSLSNKTEIQNGKSDAVRKSSGGKVPRKQLATRVCWTSGEETRSTSCNVTKRSFFTVCACEAARKSASNGVPVLHLQRVR